MGLSQPGTAAARRAQYGEGSTDRGRRTRAALLVAARDVFERDGYVDARVADVARLAGVAHGTFYTYFDSKREVFRAVMAEVRDQISDATSVPAGGDRPGGVIERLDMANRRFLDVYRRNRRLMLLFEQVATIDPEIGDYRTCSRLAHVDRIAGGIRRLQRRGLADADLDARTAAAALVSMLSNFAYHWLAMGEAFDEELAKRTLTRLWAGAIGLREAGQRRAPRLYSTPMSNKLAQSPPRSLPP
jgi:AcrR family transcriptional regulator